MDKKEAIVIENERHKTTLKLISFADEIAKKVEPLLPSGWSSGYFHLLNELLISNSEANAKDNKKPSEEFKLICKILKEMGGWETLREAKVNRRNNEIIRFEATFSFSKDGIPKDLMVDVIQYHPDHKCEIKWETKTYQKAIISDACLGLGGE